MKAAYKAARDRGIEVRDLPVPEISEKEVLLKVKVAAICGTDIHLYEWSGWCENVKAKNPMIIGHEVCGEVIEVGSQVSKVKVGDLVAAETHIPCGDCMLCRTGKEHICKDLKILGVHTDGVFAEYVKIPEVCAWKLTEGTPPEIGAVYEPFTIAVHGVLKDKIGGCSTAVFGSGPIGLFAIGVASVCGADPLFAVDINDYRLGLAKKMADNVITLNPTRDDVVGIIKDRTNGYGADVAIELSGSVKGTQDAFASLRKSSRICLIGLQAEDVTLNLVRDITYKEATVYGITGREMFDNWYTAEKLINSGRIDIKPVLTHEFALDEVEKAILTAKEGKCGKPYIRVSK